LERERAAEVRERAREYARGVKRPTAAAPLPQPHAQPAAAAGARGGGGGAMPIALPGGAAPQGGLQGLEAEHARGRLVAEQIRRDLSAMLA
jgi:hypothetical protein